MLWCRRRRFVVYVLVMCTGYWQLGESCNERREECAQTMNNALAMESPEQRCSGLTQYVACVQEDIADCQDKSSDQYALNLKNLHCSKAYICSTKLKQCYIKFTSALKRTIERSDNVTRTQICRDLMTEIMTCQENVTSLCQGQAGLMDTVKQYQMGLNTVCNNTDPCVDMVLQCQKSIVTIGTDNGPKAEKTPPLLSDCASQKPLDYCGAYRQASSCIRAGRSACADQLTVDNTLANLDNTMKELCDPVTTCSQNLSTCLCHINKQSLDSPLAIMTTICATFPPFERCLDSLGPTCEAQAQVKAEVQGLNDTYRDYHTLYCTTQRGLCPPTLQCLAQLPREEVSLSSGGQSDMYTSVFHISTLCSGASSLFRCLETASTQCQNKAGDVTFTMLEDNFLDMCLDIGPHRQTLTTCSSFTQCLREFDSKEPALSANGKSGDSSDTVRRKFASLTKTEFWCKYLIHGFQCISEMASTCSLSDQLVAESIQRRNDLQRKCQGPATSPPTTRAPNSNGGVTVRPSKGRNHGTSIVGSSHHHWILLLCAVTISFILSLPPFH